MRIAHHLLLLRDIALTKEKIVDLQNIAQPQHIRIVKPGYDSTQKAITGSPTARQGLAVLMACAVVVLKHETSTLRQRHNFISIDFKFGVGDYVREDNKKKNSGIFSTAVYDYNSLMMNKTDAQKILAIKLHYCSTVFLSCA